MKNRNTALALVAVLALSSAPAYAAAKATVNLSGTVTGLRDGTLKISAPAFKASSAIGQKQTVSLTTSLAAITVPSGTTAVLLVMPAGNTNSVSLAGATGAAQAEQIHLGATAAWAFLPLASGATLVASASATTAVNVTFF